MMQICKPEASDKIRSKGYKGYKHALISNGKAESAGKDAYEQATKDLNDRIMPIGAKMYQSASEDTKSDDSKSTDSSSDEPVEGEVVDK